MKKLFLTVIGVTFLVSTINAGATYITNFEDGNIMTADGMKRAGTTGADMAGMGVIAMFADGNSENLFWNTADSGVDGDGWSLTLSSFNKSTFTSNYWILEADETLDTSIVGLLLDGSSGRTVFDQDFLVNGSKTEGTSGSSVGDTFQPLWWSSGYDVTVTYSNIVGIDNENPVGDLYSSLFIEFTDDGLAPRDSFWSGKTAQSFRFYADTDTTTSNITGAAPVPEPATMLLFGVGLTGLAARLRRKEKYFFNR